MHPFEPMEGLRIVVAAPGDRLRGELTRWLRQRFCEVREADDALACDRIVREFRPHALVFDPELFAPQDATVHESGRPVVQLFSGLAGAPRRLTPSASRYRARRFRPAESAPRPGSA